MGFDEPKILETWAFEKAPKEETSWCLAGEISETNINPLSPVSRFVPFAAGSNR